MRFELCSTAVVLLTVPLQLLAPAAAWYRKAQLARFNVPANGATWQVKVGIVEGVEHGNAWLNREVLAEFAWIAELEIERFEPSQACWPGGASCKLLESSRQWPAIAGPGKQAIVDQGSVQRELTAGHVAVVIGDKAVQIIRFDLAAKGAEFGAGKQVAVRINAAAVT